MPAGIGELAVDVGLGSLDDAVDVLAARESERGWLSDNAGDLLALCCRVGDNADLRGDVAFLLRAAARAARCRRGRVRRRAEDGWRLRQTEWPRAPRSGSFCHLRWRGLSRVGAG